MVRSNRAEIKYNVTTDFPHLGLHSAAASGDVGLVKYALSHGQPINSVLDGVLPLHAACSGGNDLVVRLLIEHGADVNAPRLPRRYSNDRHRDASAPIVGTSGSTPLHFAAANGHSVVVSTLLLHGAHAHRPDKHGITPEMLARQNGWLECADLLRAWQLNKDNDLKEREVLSIPSSSDVQDGSMRKKLYVKRSIDNALHKLNPEPQSPLSSIRCHLDPPSPVSGQASTDTSFLTLEPITDSEGSHRLSPPPPRTQIIVPSHSSNPLASPQRPRSAGTGTEAPRNTSPHPRRLGSKYSLLHLFKKAQATGEDASSSTDTDISQCTFLSFNTPTSPISIAQSAALSTSPNDMSISPTSPSDFSSRSFPSRSTHDMEAYGYMGAMDVHRTMAQQHHRVRSSSGFSGQAETDGDEQQLPRSFRNHNRSSSQGQSQPLGARFMRRLDSASSSNLRHGGFHSQQQQHLDFGSRASPLGRLKSSLSSQSLQRMVSVKAMPDTTSPGDVFNRISPSADDDEEEYGAPIDHPRFVDNSTGSMMHLNGLSPDGHPRERSISSSSSSICQDTGDTFEAEYSIQPSPLDEQLLAVPLHPGRSDSRARGDSVSSMSTTGSTIPQTNSSGTSTTSKSSNPTPGVEEVYATIPSSRAHDSVSSEIGTTVADDHTVSSHRLNLGQRRSHTPLDINIRSISSHAQAEALVQHTQQSILEMADEFNTDELFSSGPSTGRTPLSAKLAAYGESLAIQRKWKQEEGKRAAGSIEELDEGRSPPQSPATTPSQVGSGFSGRPKKSSSRLDRQSSLDKKLAVHHRSKIHVPKRPNTGGGTPLDVSILQLQSRSFSIDNPIVGSLLEPSKHEDGLEAGGDVEMTAYQVVSLESPTESLSERGKDGRSRQLSSATKLTRMGFANTDSRQVGGPHASSHRPLPGNKVIFGGIKTLMQSLKGRS